jgi:RNA polymerase sigma-70 factor
MQARDLFEILARENSGMLTAYLRCHVHSPQEAEDLFQESLVTAWRNLDKFDRDRPFGPWLRGIAANLVLAHYRKAARQAKSCEPVVLQQLEERFALMQKQPGDTWDEKLEGLRDCLKRLPGHFRDAVRLRYEEDLSGPKLAERLQISLENMKKRLQRGRQWLLECLGAKLAASPEAR